MGFQKVFLLFVVLVVGIWFEDISPAQSRRLLHLDLVRNLELALPLPRPGRPYVSAASGLIYQDNRFWVVSDDEFYLFRFQNREDSLQAIQVLALPPQSQGDLKKIKPDFEAIAPILPDDLGARGGLLLWPSLSKERRMKAVFIAFNEEGAVVQRQEFDLSRLAQGLRKKTGALNIEGLVITPSQVLLFQRGNDPRSDNGVFAFDRKSFFKQLQTSEWVGGFHFSKINLGSVQGLPITFSDAALTSVGIFVLGTVENSPSAIEDGRYEPTRLFLLNRKGIFELGTFDQLAKLEGLSVIENLEYFDLFLTDDSDSNQPSRLYRTQIRRADFRSLY